VRVTRRQLKRLIQEVLAGYPDERSPFDVGTTLSKAKKKLRSIDDPKLQQLLSDPDPGAVRQGYDLGRYFTDLSPEEATALDIEGSAGEPEKFSKEQDAGIFAPDQAQVQSFIPQSANVRDVTAADVRPMVSDYLYEKHMKEINDKLAQQDPKTINYIKSLEGEYPGPGYDVFDPARSRFKKAMSPGYGTADRLIIVDYNDLALYLMRNDSRFEPYLHLIKLFGKRRPTRDKRKRNLARHNMAGRNPESVFWKALKDHKVARGYYHYEFSRGQEVALARVYRALLRLKQDL